MYVDKGQGRKTKPDKVYRIKRTKKGNFKGYDRIAGGKTVNQVFADARKILLRDMAKLSARKIVATKKSVRNKLQKAISEKRSLYNKIK